MPTLEVRFDNISKAYGDKVLFTDINAVVKPGECLVVRGRNGSGKSTLLKLAAGLLRPTSGKIEVQREGQKLALEERAGCYAMVSPELMLYSQMTGYENIRFFAQMRGLTVSAADIFRYGQMTGLAHCLQTRVADYSSGMRQRLKFAVLLAVKAPLWLLDEPSTNLDGDGKTIVSGLIESAIQAERTIIMATNEEWEAAYGTKQIVLA